MTGTPEKGHLMLRAPFLKQPVHLRVLAILDGIRLLWFWCCERWRFAQSAIRLLEAAIQAVECSGWIKLRLLVSLQLGHSYLPDTHTSGRPADGDATHAPSAFRDDACNQQNKFQNKQNCTFQYGLISFQGLQLL